MLGLAIIVSLLYIDRCSGGEVGYNENFFNVVIFVMKSHLIRLMRFKLQSRDDEMLFDRLSGNVCS